MNSKHLLLAMMLCSGVAPAMARDVHGVNGYYNWTAQQMKSESSPFYYWGDGRKYTNWKNPDAQFVGDYVKFIMGLNDSNASIIDVGKSATTTTKAQKWRLSFDFTPAEPLKITKKYPVMAWKFSLPENALDSARSDVFTEFWWINPYNGKKQAMKSSNTGIYDIIKGIGGNARMTLWAKYPNKMVNTVGYAENTLGQDSSVVSGNWNLKDDKLSENGFIYNGYIPWTANGVTDTTNVFIRLPKTSGERAEFILLTNYYSIADTSAQAVASKRLLDRIAYLQVPLQNFNFYCQADTANADGTVKTQDQWPTVYFKWMKTFTSVKAAMDAISKDNNWGDGTESAYKSQLNYALYYAEQILKGFKFRNSDPANPDDAAYVAYQKAYNDANTVYSASTSTDTDYEAAATALQVARVAFMEAADISKSLVYNYIKSATGSGSITVGNDDVTIGTTTGKALTIGSNDAAAPLSFVATGNVVNGQRTYTLQNANGAVVQASDGTLLLVKGGTGSVFTFTERDTEGHNFDMMSGDYYYYLNSNGVLSCTKAIPDEAADNFDALSSYLFTVTDALADYMKNASDDEKSGLFSGWEFNSTPVEDPGTHGTVDGVEKIMGENTQTKMIDNWRMSRWRPFSRVNQETVKGSDKSDLKCLVLTSAATYDSYDGATTGITNDFSGPAAMRLDGGKQVPFYVRDPSPRDSSVAFYLNPGINRYFAIKMKMTSDVTFNTLTFLAGGTGNSTTINAKQITGTKGDVVYWDMLANGFSVGKQIFTSAFFSPSGFTSKNSKLYVDWIRTYSSLTDIPEESFAADATGITNVGVAGNASLNVSGRTVGFGNGVYIYNTAGTLVYTSAGNGNVTLKKGVYLLKSGNNETKKLVIR